MLTGRDVALLQSQGHHLHRPGITEYSGLGHVGTVAQSQDGDYGSLLGLDFRSLWALG